MVRMGGGLYVFRHIKLSLFAPVSPSGGEQGDEAAATRLASAFNILFEDQ
jgi:hypothetical protein